jgi:hypothetical protein
MTTRQQTTTLQNMIAAIVITAVLPLILLALGLYLVAGLLMHIAVWCVWCTRGRDVLLVYSNSPIWQSYVEEHLLPRLAHRAVVLNWSNRRTWGQTLSVATFRFFGGSREYNPMAIVFRPFRLARSFRFYKPFREFKHGKPQAVAELTEELFAWLA